MRYFCQTVFQPHSILAHIFPGREMPIRNSRLFPIVGTLSVAQQHLKTQGESQTVKFYAILFPSCAKF